MKKVISLLLAMVLMILLCACGGNNDKDGENNDLTREKENQSDDGTTEQANDSDGNKNEVKTADLDFKIEYCRFADDLYGSDEERKSWGYQKFDNKVYVVTSIIVTNKSIFSTVLDNFSGYCMYDDYKYDMQLACDSYSGTVSDWKNTDEFPADTTGRFYMFAKLPEEACNNDSLEVVCNFNGKEETLKIEEKDNRTPLEKKKELKAGDKEHLPCGNGSVDFEVLGCTYSEYLETTSVSNPNQYISDKPFIDVILKVENNMSPIEGAEGLSDIYGYVSYNDTLYIGSMKIETNDNTKLDFGSVGFGKTEIVHLFASIEEDIDIKTVPYRFNLGGNCYYIYAK